MSKMLEHHHFKNRKYDIVVSIDSIEHCIDLDGFIDGLNTICSKYFICFCLSAYHFATKEQINISSWDAAIHKFMIERDKLEENLLNPFAYLINCIRRLLFFQ